MSIEAKSIVIPEVHGIIWDLDGTLLNSFGLYQELIGEVVAEHGLEMPTYEHMANNYHGSLEDSIRDTLDLQSDEEIAQMLETFLRRQDPKYDNPEEHLFNDALLLAQQAAHLGIVQLIVTNRNHEGRGSASPRAIVAATALAECISEILAGDEVVYRKPDAQVANDWLQKHNISPNNLLVIGDQHVDAELASNLGARALLIRRNGEIPHLDELDPKHNQLVLVNSLHDVVITNS